MELIEHQLLFHHLKKLALAGTVLHLFAHPDDEDIGLISYINYKQKGRSVSWSATRGEGGQNRVNDYQGDALGVFRTWETLNARRIDGGECLFGPFIDFGFSKNADETFSKWGREHILRELVYAIRSVQPQIVVSRWTGAEIDGHGHHQAIGETAMEAFDMAGSEDCFEDMGLPPWVPSRLYCCTNRDIFPSGKKNPEFEGSRMLKINTGEYDSFIGSTYQEIAWKAYNRYQTQGIGMLPVPGDFYYYLDPIRSEGTGPESDLFDGINRGFSGIVSGMKHRPSSIASRLEEAGEQVNRAIGLFSQDDPCSASSPLLKALEILGDLRERLHEEELSSGDRGTVERAVDLKKRELEKTISSCMGFRLESICTRGKVTPGESVWVRNTLWNFNHVPIDEARFHVNIPTEWKIKRDGHGITTDSAGDLMESREVFICNEAELSCPYWLKGDGDRFFHEKRTPQYCQQPFSEALLSVDCIIKTGGHSLTISSPTLFRKSFAGGFSELPMAVVPPISIHPEYDKKVLLVSPSEQRLTLKVTVRCNDEERPAKGHLRLNTPEGWEVTPSFYRVELPAVDGVETCIFKVRIPSDASEGRYMLRYAVECSDRDYNVILTPVRMGIPGLPHPDNASTCIKEDFILRAAEVSTHLINGHFLDGKYAYVKGAKEEVVSTLNSVGLDFYIINDDDLVHKDLSVFDSIVIGPNAYLIREELKENAHRFLEYIEHGGTLIVQYHGYDYQSYDYKGRGFAPYPFSYNRPHDRVTNENAAIEILEPEDPILCNPNPIDQKDFNGWVHDRGLYFFGQWDNQYTPLLSSADINEPQKKGGLMKCEYGEGTYIYVGYSLYRQIPKGVAGAYRLFFNLVSQGPLNSGSEK